MSEDRSSVDFFKSEGYAIFRHVHDEDTTTAMRNGLLDLNKASEQQAQWWFGNTLELLPKLMLPIVSNPLLLDFADQIIGPFMQLDNLTLAAFQSESSSRKGEVAGWHRDRWAQLPKGRYEKPWAFNAISYLQDMDDLYGPLRVIPRSHVNPVSISEDQQRKPHPDELLVYAHAGDVIFTHNALIHSGTTNVSGRLRFFFSIYYNHSWLKHTDCHSGPNCQEILERARERGDHRVRRLLGDDAQLQNRCNWGFLKAEEARWKEWIEADKNAFTQQSNE